MSPLDFSNIQLYADRFVMNQNASSELKTLLTFEKTKISFYPSGTEMPLPPVDTEHCWNLESNDLKFGKRLIIVQVLFVEFFQSDKIFTVLFSLIFFNISPGELARTAFLITFVGQTVERGRLAEA